jgi:drug/metabolite transporter (DMT)-like permease
MEINKSRQSYLYAGVAILLWSTVPTAFKIALGQSGIPEVLTIASLTSSLVLLIIVIATGKTGMLLSTSLRDLAQSAVLGLINPFIYYIILLRAYKLLPAQVAQPLNMIWPIILVFLAVLILGQKVSARSFIALFISFAGVYIISSRGKPFSSLQSDLTGILLATGSSVFWALYFILNMKDRRDEGVKLLLNFLFGTIYLLIALLVTKHDGPGFNTEGILAAVYIGLFEMGITFFLWLRALQLSGSAANVSNLVYLAPFLSLIFVHYILKEPVYYTTPIGLIVIISGILIQQKRSINSD